MRCIRCQQDIPEGSLFCNRCGKKQSFPVQQKQRRRRAKGTGSVYKLSGKRARPWAISLGGKVLGTYATSSEAVTALDEIVASQVPAEYAAYTFADVYAAWSEAHFQKIGRSAATQYRYSFKVAAPLHNKRIRSLRVDDYQSAVNALRSKGNGYEHCRKLKLLLSQVCEYAMQLDIISKNYAQYVTLPPPPAPKERVFTAEEIQVITNMTADNKFGEIAKITIVLIETGCRIGELLGIKQSDVHLSERYMIGGSKTEAGRNRIIPISKAAMPFISQWMETAGEYLLQSSNGQLKYRNVRYRFEALMDKCDIKDVTPHTCRHTAATRMVIAGIDPAKVKRILGHASFSTTVDIYTHLDAASLVDAIDNLTND